MLGAQVVDILVASHKDLDSIRNTVRESRPRDPIE